MNRPPRGRREGECDALSGARTGSKLRDMLRWEEISPVLDATYRLLDERGDGVTNDDVEALLPGMEPEQVRHALGVLVEQNYMGVQSLRRKVRLDCAARAWVASRNGLAPARFLRPRGY